VRISKIDSSSCVRATAFIRRKGGRQEKPGYFHRPYVKCRTFSRAKNEVESCLESSLEIPPQNNGCGEHSTKRVTASDCTTKVSRARLISSCLGIRRLFLFMGASGTVISVAGLLGRKPTLPFGDRRSKEIGVVTSKRGHSSRLWGGMYS